MTKRLTKAAVITAMVLSMGLHWTVLQTVAWVGMFVDYSTESSFGVSLSKTFDGRTQCDLCRFIATGKKQEREQNPAKSFQTGKIDLLMDTDDARLFAPDLRTVSIRPDPQSSGLDAGPPPSPPPLA